MKKRLISLLLAFSMMLTFLPAGAVSAFAEENIIADGATIEQGGTYSLSGGSYTEGIKIDTSAPVTINIAEGAIIKNNGCNSFLEVKE